MKHKFFPQQQRTALGQSQSSSAGCPVFSIEEFYRRKPIPQKTSMRFRPIFFVWMAVSIGLWLLGFLYFMK